MPKNADRRRSKGLEARLRALPPENELAYRYLYREHSPPCRLDPAWRARIAEILGQLDADGLARALARAAELSQELRGNLRHRPSTARDAEDRELPLVARANVEVEPVR